MLGNRCASINFKLYLLNAKNQLVKFNLIFFGFLPTQFDLQDFADILQTFLKISQLKLGREESKKLNFFVDLILPIEYNLKTIDAQ